ncbi:MAG: DNA mismatch repair endonuclease MutL [Bacteroidetes bacterium]|nr:MAG: DNA mismatch repair endonuclease MutL [Bacteroidota bacterium]
MSDIIKLLPDSVANQIAAGEVVQRPASVVKELLENSIDAGATDIKLIVKDAGRTLVQVSDNGTGMSETDARMCFERHATSKISNANDLFALRTMGFRGEALASIGSVARVELKTRMEQNTLGTEIIIEGSRMVSQTPCNCPKGTSVAVKNLFFNTPARRNFLKSDNVEKNHIYNEFARAALAYPDISFSYYHNNQLNIQTQAGNLNQRIIQLFGNSYKSRLIPIDESTEIVMLKGFVLKPEFAKKSRGEQYFFVNNRYVRSPYLNHAVEYAYADLIPDDSYPSFFIFLEIEPSHIDVNVHPTKTEIKFQDEKYIYQILRASVKRSLGKFNIVPSLDFERETAFDDLNFDKKKPVSPPIINVDPDYNPFGNTKPQAGKNLTQLANIKNWEKLYNEDEITEKDKTGDDIKIHHEAQQTVISADWEKTTEKDQVQKFMHLHGRFILTPIKSGLMVIDQQRAHERILFEKHLKLLKNQKVTSQTLLYPEQIKLSEPDVNLLNEIRKEISALGFEIADFGKHTFIIKSIPADMSDSENLQQVIESILENFKKFSVEVKLETRINLARSLAKSLSAKHGKIMTENEMNALADMLFSCEMPYQTPSGKPIISIISYDELGEKFR